MFGLWIVTTIFCSEAIEYLNSVIETSYYDCVFIFGFKYRYDDRMQDSMIGCKNKVVNGCQLLNVMAENSLYGETFIMLTSYVIITYILLRV